VTALGAALMALGWSAGRALTVTASGSEGPSAEELRSLLQRMAPDSPRGVEIPQGTDADLLSAIGVVEDSSNALVAAAIKLVKLMRPPTPWQLSVSGSTDTIEVVLTRNRRLVQAFATERATAFRFLETPEESVTTTEAEEADAELPSLAPFAAALAVVRMATETGSTQGLAGATKFQSVALQYLAGLEPTGSTRGQAMWAEAVSLDAGNLLARTGYWHARFRLAARAEDLERYVRLLEELLTGVVDPAAAVTGDARVVKNEPPLAARLLYVRVAVGVNRNALVEDVAASPLPDQALVARATTLKNLLAKPARERDKTLDNDFVDTMRRRTKALLLSVPSVEYDNDEMKAALPESEGPFVNHSLACYYATLEPPQYGKAVQHLAAAEVRPTLKSWRSEDPQLKQLVASPEYREVFAAAVPSEPLDVYPFKPYAESLRATGLVTLERIAARVEDLGPTIAPPVTRWLRQVAELGIGIKQVPALADWALVLASLLAARGVVSQAAARATPDLAEEVANDLMAYEASPNADALRTWLTRVDQTRIVIA